MINIIKLIVFILIGTLSGYAQTGSYIDFNSDLIWLRNAIKKGDWVQAQNHQAVILRKWTGIKEDFKKQYGTNISMQQSFNNYQKAYDKKNSGGTIESIEGLIDDMHDMRIQKNQPLPFDVLWKAYQAYKQVHSTVNDQMMNLYDWFEFNDQINEYMCRWDDYEVLSKNELVKYYPNFDYGKKEELVLEMRGCIEDFMRSTESGFRPDFVMPCDRIGQVLDESLLLFTIKNREIF